MIYVNTHITDTERVEGLYQTLALTAVALARHLTPDTPRDDRDLRVVDAAISYLVAADAVHADASGDRCDWCYGERISRYESSPITCACERILGPPRVGMGRPPTDVPTGPVRWLARLSR